MPDRNKIKKGDLIKIEIMVRGEPIETTEHSAYPVNGKMGVNRKGFFLKISDIAENNRVTIIK